MPPISLFETCTEFNAWILQFGLGDIERQCRSVWIANLHSKFFPLIPLRSWFPSLSILDAQKRKTPMCFLHLIWLPVINTAYWHSLRWLLLCGVPHFDPTTRHTLSIYLWLIPDLAKAVAMFGEDNCALERCKENTANQVWKPPEILGGIRFCWWW